MRARALESPLFLKVTFVMQDQPHTSSLSATEEALQRNSPKPAQINRPLPLDWEITFFFFKDNENYKNYWSNKSCTTEVNLADLANSD